MDASSVHPSSSFQFERDSFVFANELVWQYQFDAGGRMSFSRNPRKASPREQRIVFPGYPSLRAFSEAQEALLKAELGGAWRCYFLRSHWRMVFPVWRAHQER